MDEKQFATLLELRLLEYMRGNVVMNMKMINDGELFEINNSIEGGDYWFGVYKALEQTKSKLDEAIARRRGEIKK